MKWLIRDRVGDVRMGGVHNVKADALRYLKIVRDAFPLEAPFTLYRLTTRRDRLKRKLKLEAECFDGLSEQDGVGADWYSGYARALRDVASQL